MTHIADVFPKLRTAKKCIKGPVPEDPSPSNMAKGPRHCLNLHDRPFIIYIDQYEGN